MSGLRTYLALQERNRVAYKPGEESAGLVSALALELGCDPVPLFEAHGAWIELGEGATIGDVVDRVIRRRGIGPQGRLFE